MNKTLKICTIGGGSGMPVVNKALVTAGFKNIKSIVTTFDSGGDTGRMRTDERGKIMAFSDYWRSLISLWIDGKQKEVWEEMLRFRDGRSRNFGNTFFQFMSEKVGDLSKVDELFSLLTGAEIRGSVIPVSLSPADICFKTISGNEYYGEHYLDGLRMSMDKVEKIWLTPKVKANPMAIQAIETAEVIIMCPGSMYGSVIINLLPIGIKEAFNKSRAKKILMTNLMSVANENDKFTQLDYVKTFSKYLNIPSPFDVVVMADFDKFDKENMQNVLNNYALEHSYPITYKKADNVDFKTMIVDIAVIEMSNIRLRHSVTKLSNFFKALEV